MEKVYSIANERVCDLVDGRVQDGECAQVIEALLSDDQAAQTWHTYHVIGDVLRSAELAPTSSDHAFLERLERRLALEPLRRAVTESEGVPAVVAHLGLPSANASVFRWKMFAGVASFALVGVVGFGLWTQTGQQGDAQIAAQSVVAPSAPASVLVVAETGAGTMLRDARLDELMAAHRQLGGHSALQVPAGFLHTATYEGPNR
jgi:sigma-E factor negative regulatory protein RseA